MDQDEEPLQQTRNEVTVPTKLNLQFLQQQRGNKSAVVSSMIAGSYCSALLTRAPDELPDQRPSRLADRSVYERLVAAVLHVCLCDCAVARMVCLPVVFICGRTVTEAMHDTGTLSAS